MEQTLTELFERNTIQRKGPTEGTLHSLEEGHKYSQHLEKLSPLGWEDIHDLLQTLYQHKLAEFTTAEHYEDSLTEALLKHFDSFFVFVKFFTGELDKISLASYTYDLNKHNYFSWRQGTAEYLELILKINHRLAKLHITLAKSHISDLHFLFAFPESIPQCILNDIRNHIDEHHSTKEQ